MARAPITLDDGIVLLGFDGNGRIVRFRSHATGVNFLTVPGIADNWRIMVHEDGYAISYILGKEQTPDQVIVAGNRVGFHYETLTRQGRSYPIALTFSAWLEHGEARFSIDL